MHSLIGSVKHPALRAVDAASWDLDECTNAPL